MSRFGLVLLLIQGNLFTAFAADASSTPSHEQAKTLTEPTAAPPLYQVNNEAGEPCIFMEMNAYVSINWDVSSNETKEMDMILQPSKVQTTGSCGDEEAQITLKWKSFRLQWTFSKTRDWKKWFAKEVELHYDISILDQHTNSTIGVASTHSNTVMLASASIGEAYHCLSENDLELNSSGTDSAMLRLHYLRVPPFLDKPEFGPSYCPIHTTSADESSTISSSTLGSSVTKRSSDTLVHSNLVSPTPIPALVSRMTTLNKPTDSANSVVGTTNSHPVSPRGVPLSGSTKTPISSPSSDHTSFHESVSPTTTSPKTSGLTTFAATPLASFPPYVYQKTLSNEVKMSFYPPKKMFFSGVKLDNNDALTAMLWSWYTSGFYTGYYQALQQSKKM